MSCLSGQEISSAQHCVLLVPCFQQKVPHFWHEWPQRFQNKAPHNQQENPYALINQSEQFDFTFYLWGETETMKTGFFSLYLLGVSVVDCLSLINAGGGLMHLMFYWRKMKEKKKIPSCPKVLQGAPEPLAKVQMTTAIKYVERLARM